jgi:diguanylate cyclase (GGDEF)-like protein
VGKVSDKTKELDEQIHRQAFDIIPLGLLIVDKDKKIKGWNRWLEENTNISFSKAKNTTLASLFPDKDYSRFDWALEQVTTYKNPQVLSQALNKFLIPIEMHDTHYKDIKHMQQHVELHPLESKKEPLSLVVITDVTSKFYEKTDLLNLARKYNTESIHDDLTGTYNRRYMWDWLDNAINSAERKNLRIVCCLFDIDHFKEINDTYGHKTGDKYILQFVKVVNSLIRGGDVFIRYGGDEFITIANLDKTSDNITELASRIVKNFFEPKNSDFPFQLSCSCGVSVWSKTDNQVTANELIQQADKALYKAKSAGRNCFWVYSNDLENSKK